MAKYFKLLDSAETEIVQPVDVLSNELTFSRKHSSWKKLLCAAVFIALIALVIVFIALYAHEISKKERGTATTATKPVCLSHTCVLTASG